VAGAKVAQNQLNFDARALDAGLTHHDGRVGRDARV
jgi:hypothetical protein